MNLIQKEQNKLIDIDVRDDIVIIYLRDEIHVESVPFIKSAIKEKVSNLDKNIIVDLSDTIFLDSVGVGLFASLLKQTNEKKNIFAFAGTQGQPRAVLSMVGFDQITRHYSCLEAALKEMLKTS